MSGFFGTVGKQSCVTDLFYGTDYNSHLGTRRAGMATFDAADGQFSRSIHNLENTYFRTKFESDLGKFRGNSGIGIISDTDPQPIVINSHLGKFAIVTVAKIANMKELEDELLEGNMHFGELSSGNTNQTELIALLIIQGKTFTEGIENVFNKVKGSCSMLLLTDDGDLAHRLLSPRRHVDKLYYARLERPLGEADRAAFAGGVTLEDGTVCRPAGLELLGDGREVMVTLHEGKFHQIKRMVASRGSAVCYLKRIAMGPLRLDETLKPGEYRPLTGTEVLKIGGKT